MKPKKPKPGETPAPLPDATPEDVKAPAPIPVDCPEVGPPPGRRMYVRLLSGPELDRWDAEQYALVDAADERKKAGHAKPGDAYASMENVHARLVHRTAALADGTPFFSQDAAGLAQAEQLHPKALDRLYHVARVAHGMTEGSLEELAGKSAAGPGSDSGTD